MIFFYTISLVALATAVPIAGFWARGDFVGQAKVKYWQKQIVIWCTRAGVFIAFAIVLFTSARSKEKFDWFLGAFALGSLISVIISFNESFKDGSK